MRGPPVFEADGFVRQMKHEMVREGRSWRKDRDHVIVRQTDALMEPSPVGIALWHELVDVRTKQNAELLKSVISQRSSDSGPSAACIAARHFL